jgi:hypothetical protein
MDTWKAVSEERSTLADDLAALDDDQWDAQSLCREWKVRHVVGHVIAGADVKTGPFIANAQKWPHLQSLHRAPPGAKHEITLTDLVCHCAHIRRPIGITRSVPKATLLTVADTVKRIGFPIQTKKRIAGLRISAIDSEWSTGDGPSVEGPLASLILVMAGRKAPLEDLSGEGAQILPARV